MGASNQPVALNEEIALLRDRVADMEQRVLRFTAGGGDGLITDPLIVREERGDGTFQRAFLDARPSEGSNPQMGVEVGVTGSIDEENYGSTSQYIAMGLGANPDDPPAAPFCDFELPQGSDLFFESSPNNGGRANMFFDVGPTDDHPDDDAFGGIVTSLTNAATDPFIRVISVYSGLELGDSSEDGSFSSEFQAEIDAQGAMDMTMHTSHRVDDGIDPPFNVTTGITFGHVYVGSFDPVDLTGPYFGIFDKGYQPADGAIQQGPFAAADGTLADATTQFNALLASLRVYGWLKE